MPIGLLEKPGLSHPSNLPDARLSLVQRQALAERIGHVQGNRTLLRVMASRSDDRSAAQAKRGASTLTGSDKGASPIQRFGSAEHKQLGDQAVPGETVDIDLGDGTRLTYGDMVALAGDYFGSLAEMRTLATTPDGQAQLRWARYSALGGPVPSVSEDVKKRVNDRYYALAARNISHFSAGGTARNSYETGHEEALRKAFMAGLSEATGRWSDAITTEAFCNHYLTDMFSAGHVRTPRQEMMAWYQANFPDSLDRFVNYFARHMTNTLDGMGDIPWYWPNSTVTSNLKRKILDLGGPAMASFTLGDIVSLAYHNQDNKGLGVVSDVDPQGNEVAGGYRWTAKGDDHLADSPITREMAVAAVQASRRDLDLVRAAGQQASSGPALSDDQIRVQADRAIEAIKPYKAERFIPREDTSAGNAQMNWRWGEMDPTLREALDQTVRVIIANTLRDKAGQVPEVERRSRTGEPSPDGAVTLHVRAAFLAFCNDLSARGIGVLEEAINAAASPPPDVYLDAGVPLPAGVPDDSMDAGVPVPG